MENIKKNIQHLFYDGFFHILGSSFANKCIAFLTNLLIVRILSKSEYGIFTGSFNVFFIAYLFSGLGITSGLLYFCSKDIEKGKKSEYYRYSWRFGLATELFLSLGIVIYGFAGNVGIEETRKYIISLGGLPFIAFIFDYYTIILRAERDNKKYSILLNINSFLYLILGALGAFVGGVFGTIIGRYLAYGVSNIIGFVFCKPHFSKDLKRQLPKTQRTDLIRYSVKAGISSALNVILYRIDVFVITIVVANASVLASYKTGTALPENLNFIPQCVMVYFLPILIRNSADNVWLKRKIKEVYFFMGALSLIIGLCMIFFAPTIIKILWGESYLDAVPCMQILSISFIILSTFRMTSTNILLALKRAGYTMAVSIITGTVNIGLDIVLTMKYGSIGAAYATLIVTIVAAILSFPYVIHIVYGKKSQSILSKCTESTSD